MRVVGEINDPRCRITIFHWNNRYIIKLESGFMEQTFKLEQWDVSSEDDLRRIINDTFIDEAVERFAGMGKSMSRALDA